MSVILDALQKARRERLQEGYDHYQLLDQPSGRGRRRHGYTVRLIGYVLLVLMLSALCLGGGYMLWSHLHGGRIQAVSGPTPQSPGAAPSAVPAGATPGPAEVHFSDGTVIRMSGGAPAASPKSGTATAQIRNGQDLPPPVPLSELGPEAEKSLPPPPSGPRVRPAAASEPFALGAILYDENQRMAIVNGQTVQEGRTYGDFRVLKITPSEVVVQRQGERPTTLVQK